jgi:site-specific DNA recombinase
MLVTRLLAPAGGNVSLITPLIGYAQIRHLLPTLLHPPWSVDPVQRDAFERMLADVRAGRIDAIVTWQADRLLRTVVDASAIVAIAKQHGTIVANVGGTIDLGTAAGRKKFYDLAVAAEYKSDLKSERLKLKHAELAAAGLWEGGMRNFGHDLQPYPDLESGRVEYRLVPNPTEAAALQQAAKEVIAGRSHTAIAIAWNKQGLTTTGGRPFTPQKVRELLLSPKTAGLRYVDGRPVKAAWPGIITEEQHEELRAILGPRRRERTSKGLTTVRTYLLGGFLFCARVKDDGTFCGHRLTAKRAGNNRRYACMTRLGAVGASCGWRNPWRPMWSWSCCGSFPLGSWKRPGGHRRSGRRWAGC